MNSISIPLRMSVLKSAINVQVNRLRIPKILVLTLLVAVFAGETDEAPLQSTSHKNISATPTSNATQNAVRQWLHVPKPIAAVPDNVFEGKNNISSSDLINIRQGRFFGLLGSNFSLAYNLTIGGGNTVGNITVVPAAAPAYYYAPAPYSYGYYDPYGYNPYAYNPYGYYNPYAYNPYGGYNYYG